MPKTEAHYRELAERHLAQAEALLAHDAPQSARYACLELRLCIEALCYEQLCLYRSELSRTSVSHWTPKKVLQELKQIDALANESSRLSIQDRESKEWIQLGESNRFSISWANKAHNALSNALHTPTIKQVEISSKDQLDFAQRCNDYLPEARKVVDSTLWHFTLTGPNFKFTWRCGFLMLRREKAMKINSQVICSECGRISVVTEIDEDSATIEERRIVFECLQCKTENALPELDITDNLKGKCRFCGSIIVLSKVWRPFQMKNDAINQSQIIKVFRDPDYK